MLLSLSKILMVPFLYAEYRWFPFFKQIINGSTKIVNPILHSYYSAQTGVNKFIAIYLITITTYLIYTSFQTVNSSINCNTITNIFTKMYKTFWQYALKQWFLFKECTKSSKCTKLHLHIIRFFMPLLMQVSCRKEHQ